MYLSLTRSDDLKKIGLTPRAEWEVDQTSSRWRRHQCWVAYDLIPYQGPVGPEYTELYLRVERDDEGTVVWDVSISEEDAGFGDPCFAQGTSTTIEEAKVACEAAAAQLIIGEAGRTFKVVTPVLLVGADDNFAAISFPIKRANNVAEAVRIITGGDTAMLWPDDWRRQTKQILAYFGVDEDSIEICLRRADRPG